VPLDPVDLSALVDLDTLFRLGALIEIRLLAWQTVLTITGASVILWHAILTYDLFPAPYPPHPPCAALAQPSSSNTDGARFGVMRAVPSPGDAPPPPPEVASSPAPHEEATPVAAEVAERFKTYRTIPLDVARARVQELGGLEETARRLRLPLNKARRILTSERPLPPWVLDTLFDDWRGDERLHPTSA
jgi:hypothetical protein